MGQMMQDVRYALRQMRKSPGFALIAVVTLALGVGAATAVFSVIDAVMLRPLPFDHPARIVLTETRAPSGYTQPFSYPSYKDLKHRYGSFSVFAGFFPTHVKMEGPGGPVSLRVVRATDNFFDVFGVKPLMGRTFVDGEDEPGKDNVVVLSYEVWMADFSGDSAVVGKAIRMDGEPYVVIGVMPAGFRYPLSLRHGVYTPIHAQATGYADKRGAHWMRTIARLKDGVTAGQGQAEFTAGLNDLGRQYPDTDGGRTGKLRDLNEAVLSNTGGTLWMLVGAVLAVLALLAIACVNMAGLLLARSVKREREMAMRAAVGAGRVRLVRQMLTESLLLGGMSSLLGVAIAYGLLGAMSSYLLTALARGADVRMNGFVLFAAIGFASLTAVLASLVPAVRLSGVDPQRVLKAGGAAGAGRGQHGLWASFTAAQVMLSLTLSIVTGLLLQALARARSRDLGFDPAQPGHGEFVSGNYFLTFAVQAAVGRLMLPSDDAPNAAPEAVMGYQTWERDFARDPSVVGSTFELNAHPFTIVGVAPDGFYGDRLNEAVSYYMPMSSEPVLDAAAPLSKRPSGNWVYLLGRVTPGVELGPLQAKMSGTLRQWLGENVKIYQDEDGKMQLSKTTTVLSPGALGIANTQEHYATGLHLLMGIADLVLLIACANIANLVLVRGLARRGETSIRRALGASRVRLIQQILTESIVLAVLGGVAGIAVAYAGARGLLALAFPGQVGMPISPTPSPTVLGFAFAISLITGVLFSLAPAWQMMKPDMVDALKQKAGGMLGGAQRFRTAAVALQIGLSVLLLSGAGLFVRTLHQLKAQDMGLKTDHVLESTVDTTLSGVPTTDTVAVQQRVRAALAALPGVKAVGATTDPILAGNRSQGSITAEGYTPAPDEDTDVEVKGVTPDYRKSLSIGLVSGRDFTEADTKGAPKVAMVNRSLAVKYFGSVEKALGHMVTMGGGNGMKLDTQIVGVVGDSKQRGVREGTVTELLEPFDQMSHGNEGLEYYVKTTQAPEAAENMIRGAVRGVDPKLIADDMKTLDEQVDSNVSNERMIALLAACFACVALLTTAVGLYGVLAFATAQRTREIGIRMALGAQRWGVVRMVLGDMAKVAGVGIVVALPVSVALARTLKSQMFEVSAFDPITMAGCVAVTALMVLVAAAIPARRAASVEPTVALRTE